MEEGGDARDTEEAAEAEAGAHADAGGENGGGERAVLGAADAGLLVTEAAPLADMLQAILHVYGVDLLGDAGFEGRMSGETAERGGGGCGRGGVRGFEALGRVFAEGVVLCRLASSLQWVTRTKLRCLPRVAASVGALRGCAQAPRKRAQRLANIRLALSVLRSDRSVQQRGHATHPVLFDAAVIERGDAATAESLVCILYDAVAHKYALPPEAGEAGAVWHMSVPEAVLMAEAVQARHDGSVSAEATGAAAQGRETRVSRQAWGDGAAWKGLEDPLAAVAGWEGGRGGGDGPAWHGRWEDRWRGWRWQSWGRGQWAAELSGVTWT